MNNAPANDSSYQHVPVVDQMEDEEFAELDNVQSRRSKPLLLALGAVCVFAVMVAYRPSMRTAPVQDVPLWGSSKVTACTFDECARSMCNAEAAPYTCLFHNGGVHGGCSPIPWTDETCTTQCDVSGCDDLEIPDSVEDCNQACPKEWCQIGRVCGSEAPYQCTNGASAFGCSEDAYHWTFRVSEAACSSCCKASTCK